MSNIFFIGDTHFGHNNILKHCRGQFDDIEAHNEHLVERWNSVVKPNDVVWHLGDVALWKAESLTIMDRLKGQKKLVMGNHDTYGTDAFLQHFDKLFGAIGFRGGIMTHIPVHSTHLEHRWKFNIHGHMHDHNIDDDRYINVSCEQINFTPIEWEELKKRIPDAGEA